MEANFDPVKGGRLKKLGGLEGTEEVAFLLGFGVSVVQRVEDVVFEEFLVGYAYLIQNKLLKIKIKNEYVLKKDVYLDWVGSGAVLAVPGFYEGDVDGTAGAA